MASGGCLCGKVAYEADPPFLKFVRCHCSRCRRATGSAYAANLYVAPQSFRWVAGADEVVRFDLAEARTSRPRSAAPAARRCRMRRAAGAR
jgi:hypothetical protein